MMTKQEQIENMVNVMAASNDPFVDVPLEIMPQVAEALYNAGYRKEDEVRKETAKEILMKRIGNLLRIKSMFSDPLYDHRGLQDHLVAVIKIEIESVKNQAKYYGVEVEE